MINAGGRLITIQCELKIESARVTGVFFVISSSSDSFFVFATHGLLMLHPPVKFNCLPFSVIC